jgi:hypothetical protein
LDGCALSVDSSGSHGFVVYGEAGEPEDAAFRVLEVGDRELWLEVTDDHWVSGASSWLYDDHFEIWLGETPDGEATCWPAHPTLYQWGIGLATGAVLDAHGSPPARPAAEVRWPAEPGEGAVQVRVLLPDLGGLLGPEPALTVVYSDSDDGMSQERLIATSRLAWGVHRSLGAATPIPADRVRCRLVDDALQTDRVEQTALSLPVLELD